jgi:hypothetical protein
MFGLGQMNKQSPSRYYYLDHFLLICGLLLSAGCTRDKSHIGNPQASFYYWRSSFSLSNPEKAIIDSLKVRKLYIKFFDVDWNPYSQSAQPTGIIQFLSTVPESVHIVPTVFITNRTIEHLQKNEVGLLAHRISKKILSLIPQNQQNKVEEFQLDCDWTERTKLKYFHLLDSLNQSCKKNKITLSVTIRLHQYADPQRTGIPPVERGVLMFYNMGEMEGKNAQNSILDLNIGRQYLNQKKSYPIHLNIALPLFCWGVLIRGERVVNLLHDIEQEDLQDSTFFHCIGKNLYKASEGHYCNGVYIYPNDIIRFESVSTEQLTETAALIKRQFHDQSFEVIFFHLEPNLEARYGISHLRSLISSFSS